MKARVNTDMLRSAVATAIPALATVKSDSNFARAYEFIYIEAMKGRVSVCCCNLSIQIESSFSAEIEEEGAGLFPGKLFSELVRVLPGEETVLEAEYDVVKVSSGNLNMRLQSIETDGFLSMESCKITHTVKMGQGTFKRMVAHTAPMAYVDMARPILAGVLMEVDPDRGTLTMVALDGLKLAKRTEAIECIESSETGGSERGASERGAEREPEEYVVNAKLLETAARSLGEGETETGITIELAKQTMTITSGDTVMILRTMEGKYIRYRAMLPTKHDASVRIDRERFYRAIERAYLVARNDEKNNLTKLSFEEGKVGITVKNEVGQTHDNIDISMSGTPILTAFNAKYLLDILKNIGNEEFVMELTVKPGPCVIRPMEGESYYYLVLPIRLNS